MTDNRRLFSVALRLEMQRISMGISPREFERMSVVEWARRRAEFTARTSGASGAERPSGTRLVTRLS